MIVGQYIPGNSILHKMDPRAKIFGVFILMLLIFMANNVSCYLFLFGTILISLSFAHIPITYALRSLRAIWFLVLLTALLHLWTNKDGVILTHVFSIPIHQGGVDKALLVAARFILLVLAASLLTFTTSSIDLIDGLESIFKPLTRFGFPAHEFALMMSITLRFVPLLWEELQKVKKAQMSRGAKFDEGPIWSRFKYYLFLFIPLFLSIFRRSDELAVAMESRCYRGNISRTKWRQMCFTSNDAVALLVLLLVIGILLWLRE